MTRCCNKAMRIHVYTLRKLLCLHTYGLNLMSTSTLFKKLMTLRLFPEAADRVGSIHLRRPRWFRTVIENFFDRHRKIELKNWFLSNDCCEVYLILGKKRLSQLEEWGGKSVWPKLGRYLSFGIRIVLLMFVPNIWLGVGIPQNLLVPKSNAP